jgi:hypothetical protein
MPWAYILLSALLTCVLSVGGGGCKEAPFLHYVLSSSSPLLIMPLFHCPRAACPVLTMSSANTVEWFSYHQLNLSPVYNFPSSLCPQLIMYPAHHVLCSSCPMIIMSNAHHVLCSSCPMIFMSNAHHVLCSSCPMLIMSYAHRAMLIVSFAHSSPAHFLCPLLPMPSDHCIPC